MRTCMPSSSSRLIERSAAFAPAASGSKLTDDPLRVALQHLHLLRGERGAATRHHRAESRGRHADRVHVAFHQDDAILFADRLPGAVQIVEHVALLVDQRFGRVQIFRIVLRRQRPAAVADDLSGLVVDREHQAVAETVVGAAVLALAHQPGLLHLRGREVALLEQPEHRAPGTFGVAEPELLDGLPRYAALRQVAASRFARRSSQVRAEMSPAPARASRTGRRALANPRRHTANASASGCRSVRRETSGLRRN